MAVDRRVKSKAEEYLDEIRWLMLSRFPDAQFETQRIGRNEFRIYVTADFEDLFDILDVTSERRVDILVDAGIHIQVIPTRRSEAMN